MLVRDGWEQNEPARRRSQMGIQAAVLAMVVAGVLGTSTSWLDWLFAGLLLVILAVGTVIGLRGGDLGRPVVTRLDDGTGTVDAVRFGVRRLWPGLGVLFLTVVAVAMVVHPVGEDEMGWADLGEMLLASGGWVVCVALVGIVVIVRFVRRFVAVTPGALVLGAGRGRLRLPWNGIYDARQVTRTKTRSFLSRQRSYTVPSIALRLDAHAVPSPEDMRIVRRFGDVQTLSGTTPVLLLDVDHFAANHAMLHAFQWHITRPRTVETLIDGYEQGWTTHTP